MKALGWTSGIWVLTIALGLAVASCATQKSATLIKDISLPHKQQAATSISKESDSTTQAKVQAAYGKRPLNFEPNQGQTDEQVHFLSRGRGYTLFLTPTEAVLALNKAEPKAKGKKQRAKGKREEQEKTVGSTKNSLAPALGERVRVRGPDSEPPEQTVLRMQLVGANPNPRIEAFEELPGKSNYFIGNDPEEWRTNIPTYAKVKYQDVYPGIDLVYYGNQRQLEYDFVVAPGADPGAITLGFEGLVGAHGRALVQIDAQGDLILHSEGGEVRLLKPRIYQRTDGTKQTVSGRYVLKGKLQVGFQVAAYDASRPLIIDPVLSYSTYLGGSGGDEGWAIAVDASGNAYVTGNTSSTDFPTASPFQATCCGAFVTKLNTAGSALVYSTYLGGSGSNWGSGIAVDASGNAYVTGGASTNFPITAGAFQTTPGGGFVTKLNAAGSALLYSTYFAAAGSAIAVDSSGNTYVTGNTESTNFPTTAGVFQTTLGGNSDAFVTKLNAAGSALVYSTYLGGSGADLGFGITVDSSGNAYITGRTGSTANFPTASPLQPAHGGGTSDAFVTKVNAAGSALVYSTYLGGSDEDEGWAIAVAPSGNAYVTGFTYSTNFPTISPFQGTKDRNSDAFVTKLNTVGSALVYSTYLGGSGEDKGWAVAVDASGSAYVTGWTRSADFPTASPIQPTFHGDYDAFVTKLNTVGSALVYSTYLGGTGLSNSYDTGRGIAVDASGNAYVTGIT